jgi:hypothetical protein
MVRSGADDGVELIHAVASLTDDEADLARHMAVHAHLAKLYVAEAAIEALREERLDASDVAEFRAEELGARLELTTLLMGVPSQHGGDHVAA